MDIPQTVLEPILVKHASHSNISVRFDTSFVEYKRESAHGPITSTVKDNLTGQTYQIRTKYLFGCDGARSQVMKQLDIPLIKAQGQGLALNVFAEVDLTEQVKTRTGNLHVIYTPEIEHPPWGWSCILRMVKPWTEWMFIVLPEPGFENFKIRPSNEEYEKRMREFIGDDSIPIKILDASVSLTIDNHDQAEAGLIDSRNGTSMRLLQSTTATATYSASVVSITASHAGAIADNVQTRCTGILLSMDCGLSMLSLCTSPLY